MYRSWRSGDESREIADLVANEDPPCSSGRPIGLGNVTGGGFGGKPASAGRPVVGLVASAWLFW